MAEASEGPASIGDMDDDDWPGEPRRPGWVRAVAWVAALALLLPLAIAAIDLVV